MNFPCTQEGRGKKALREILLVRVEHNTDLQILDLEDKKNWRRKTVEQRICKF